MEQEDGAGGAGVQGAGCRVKGEGCRVQGAGCRVQGAGCRVQGTGCRVQGAGCRVQGTGCRGRKMSLQIKQEQQPATSSSCQLPITKPVNLTSYLLSATAS